MHKAFSVDHPIYKSCCSSFNGQQPPHFRNTTKRYLCCVTRTSVVRRTSSRLVCRQRIWWRTKKPGVLIIIRAKKRRVFELWTLSEWITHFLWGGSASTPMNREYDMLVNYKLHTPVAIFIIIKKQQKQIVIKSKPDINREGKTIINNDGIIADFEFDGMRSYLARFVKQVNLISVILINRDQCGIN